MILSEETRIILSFAQVGILIGVVWAFSKAYFSNKESHEMKAKKIKSMEESMLTCSCRIKDLELNHNQTKITTAVLETKLDSIEVGIADIKTMLVKHIEK